MIVIHEGLVLIIIFCFLFSFFFFFFGSSFVFILRERIKLEYGKWITYSIC